MLPSPPRPSWAVGAAPAPARSSTTRVMPLPGLPRRIRDTVQPVPPLPAVTSWDRGPGTPAPAGDAAVVGATLGVGWPSEVGVAGWLVAGREMAVVDWLLVRVEYRYRMPAVATITTRAAPSMALSLRDGDDSSLLRASTGLALACIRASR